MMNFFLFFFLVILSFSSIFEAVKAIQQDCETTKCSPWAPNIHFPFQNRDKQAQQNCGLPGFQVYCKNNNTMINFPFYRDLVVKSISYKTQKLDLLDPKSCVHEVFLNLNLSLTSFNYYYVVKNYTYLNCSVKLSSDFTEIPCLSDSQHHVYTVEPSLPLPNTCKEIKTVAIPFQFTPYLSDNSFGLGLSWDFLQNKDCDSKSRQCVFKAKIGYFNKFHVMVVISVGFFVMVIATLLSIRRYQLKKKESAYPIQTNKSLGVYTLFNGGTYHDVNDIEQVIDHDFQIN